MKKMALVLLLCLAGCTANQRAKSFGGKMTTTLPPGQKLVNLTWKDSNLWILKRQMRKDEVPEEYTFSEESSWGVVEGTIVIKEQK
ncbi:MAG: hypothetical protein M0R80_08045 [Proteobacteria bacterium]|jgi:hypothetical protein|nr:hypothetical protein [Pseudomonadota bacterium]